MQRVRHMIQRFRYIITRPPIGFGALFLIALSFLRKCAVEGIEIYIDIRSPEYADLEVNCWDTIFSQPFNISAAEASKLQTVTIYGPGDDWQFGFDSRVKFRNSDFVSCYRELISRFSVHPFITNIVSDFLSPYTGKKIIGLYKRGRDQFVIGHANGQGHLADLSIIQPILDQKISNFDYLFVMSDETYIYRALAEQYGNKVIYYNDKSRFDPNDNRPICHHPQTPEQKKASLIEAMVEVLILSKCNERLLMTGNLPHMSILFSTDNNFTFYDDAVVYDGFVIPEEYRVYK